MIIDIHTRIGQDPIHEFHQTPEELLGIMDEFDIDKSFVLPFPTMKIKENNNFVADAVKKYPDRFVGFSVINPSEKDFLDEIERTVDIGLKGVMLDPEFHRVIRNVASLEALMVLCMKHNLPVIFNTENIKALAPRSAEPYYLGLDRLAFKFPQVRLVVQPFWPQVPELMRSHRNVILYTGGHHNVPGFLPILEKVGPTRLCLGSESPRNHPAMTIKDIRKKKMPHVFKDLIVGENAKRIFRDLL